MTKTNYEKIKNNPFLRDIPECYINEESYDKDKLHSPPALTLEQQVSLVEGADRVHLPSNGDHFT